MKKILATIVKEWILMRRDIGGLLLLLLMPAVLIIVMALVQDAPFRDYQEFKFDLLLADNDHGSLAQEIENGLKNSKNFTVIDSLNGQPLSEHQLKQLLRKGDFKIGIVIPQGATAEIVNAANIVTNSITQQMGLGATLPSRPAKRGVSIAVYFDPTAKPAFRTAINFALDKLITFSSSHMLVERISSVSKTGDSTANKVDFQKIFQGIAIHEEPLNKNGIPKQYINSVQHNVPAWAIFGMFFIVISISGHMIKEREEGSALRIALIPNAFRHVAMGKIIFYTLVCTLQFFIMIAIGIWFMPLLGLPSLYTGAHPFLLLPVALCISFAATTYGYFVGAVFRTTNQAMPFGAISVVIFSAMGGIWVPIELLSPAMQQIAKASPLHWSLDAVEQIILRNGNFTDIIKPLSALLIFALALWLISIFRNSKRYQSVQ